jgi:hypothetical protein
MELVVIEYHAQVPYPGDPFFLANPDEQLARMGFYGVGSVPTIQMDGPNRSARDSTAYEDLFNERRGVPSRVSLSLDGRFDVSKGSGTLTVRVSPDGPFAGNWRLVIALTESEIFDPFPNGIDWHHDVFRRFVAGTDGVLVNFSGAGDPPIEITAPFDVDPSWVADNVKLVAMVQDLDSGQIEQAGAIAIDELSSTPVVATSWGRIKEHY